LFFSQVFARLLNNITFHLGVSWSLFAIITTRKIIGVQIFISI
jgi:hypothetical protein